MVYIVDEQEEEIYSKKRGNCEICKEPIVLGNMTLHKSGKYLCVNCQIDLNRQIEYKQILMNRRNEILFQLAEINKELYCNDERIEIS